jgi:hypothetical protein
MAWLGATVGAGGGEGGGGGVVGSGGGGALAALPQQVRLPLRSEKVCRLEKGYRSAEDRVLTASLPVG